jgi:iron uptake system component EfeO
MTHRPDRLLVPIALAVLGVASLALVACGSSDSTGSSADAQQISVKITDDGCDPTDLKATAGPATFLVSNDDSAVNNEFEILDGATIVGEEENLTEGLSAEVSVDLEPGTYDIVCGNPGDREPTGKLTVAD